MAVVVCLVTAIICYLLYKAIKGVDCSAVLALAEVFGKSPGASSGIGEDIVYQLVKCNCRLILSARRVELLRSVKIAALEKSWTMSEQDICILPLDQCDFDSLGAHVEKANKIFDRPVDIVILNAGQSQRSDWASVEPEVDTACFNLNALGPTVLARKILPSMIARKDGQFVVISSLAGVIGVPLSPSYAAAKHALNGYFRSLSLDHCHDGINVTIVCPGLTYAPNNPQNAFTNASGQKHGQVLGEITPAFMTCERAAHLVCTAAANRLTEVWLSKTKLPLMLCYMMFLLPDVVKRYC